MCTIDVHVVRGRSYKIFFCTKMFIIRKFLYMKTSKSMIQSFITAGMEDLAAVSTPDNVTAPFAIIGIAVGVSLLIVVVVVTIIVILAVASNRRRVEKKLSSRSGTSHKPVWDFNWLRSNYCNTVWQEIFEGLKLSLMVAFLPICIFTDMHIHIHVHFAPYNQAYFAALIFCVLWMSKHYIFLCR